MAVTLITVDDCPSVRAAIDVSLSADMIPDDVVMLDVFAGVADREVRDKDPDILTRTEPELVRLRTATVYYTAANLVLSVPQMIAENIGGYHYQIKSIDPNKRYQDLRAMGDGEIAAVVATDEPPNRPTIFTLASASRGI